MKKITVLIGIIFFVTIIGYKESTNKVGENEFVLNGELEGIENDSWIYLMLDNKPVDSTKIVDNKFSINGVTEHPKQYNLLVKNSQNYSRIWLESGELKFKAKDGEFKDAIIEGSNSQKESEKLWKPIWEYRKRRDSLSKIVTNDKLNDSLKLSANLELKKVHQNRLKIETEFIKNNPKSYVSAKTLHFYTTSLPNKTVSELYNSFSDDLKKSSYGKSINRYLELNKNPQIGDKYVDFSMTNESGEIIKLSDFEGKLVLLEFWSSNCVPCRKENPNLKKTYARFKDQGFEILAVSLDTKKESWLKAIEKDELPWTQVSDLKRKNTASLIYGVNGIPDNFLINPDGIIIDRYLRGEKLNDKLVEILK